MSSFLISTLYDFQKEGVAFALSSRYSINAFEAGLGKSVTALAVTTKVGGRALIVCPAYLIYNWVAEIGKHTTGSVIILNSKNYNTLRYTDYVVCSYEGMKYSRDIMWEFSTVIFDEVHYLKSTGTKRFKTAYKYLVMAPPNYCMMLSGTPIKNKVYDLYSFLKICAIRPESNGVNINSVFVNLFEFKEFFCRKSLLTLGKREIVQYEGLQNEMELQKILHKKMLRKKTDDVISLPKQIQIDVLVDYKEELELLAAWELFNKGPKVFDGHVSQVKKRNAVMKAPFTAELVANKFANGELENCVVYSDHPEAAKIIHSKLGGGYIDGTTPLEVRAKLVGQFQEGKLDRIIATVGSASVGINLTATRYLFLNDAPWSHTDLEQLFRRIRRIGQKVESIVYFIMGSKVDKAITVKIRTKFDVADRAIDKGGF